MAQVKPRSFLLKARRQIGKKVRELRLSRKWSQVDLAKQLGLSQNRLSEIERGAGSFSAEQLLLLLRLFNVAASEFVDEAADPTLVLQNALARFGASHLHEATEVTPSDRHDDLGQVVRDALIEGSPRIVTALAPILILHARHLNLRNVQAELQRTGYERRLPWVVENTLIALRLLHDPIPKKLVVQTAPLQLFLNLSGRIATQEPNAPDVLDPAIQTLKTVDQVQRHASDPSRRWGIATALRPEDFVEPLRESFAAA